MRAAVRGPVWTVKHANYPGACLNEADVRRMSYDRHKGSDTSRQVQSHNAAPTNITALSSLLNHYFRLAVTAPRLLSSLPLYDGARIRSITSEPTTTSPRGDPDRLHLTIPAVR